MANLQRLAVMLAEQQESAAAGLRAFAESIGPSAAEADGDSRSSGDAVGRARQLHPALGPRQAEALRLVAQAGPSGADTGTLSREMSYDQANVYLTLQALVRHRLLRKETTSVPHRYFLSSALSEGHRDR